ncbi:MAG: helix-turn-helix transcriptional regulator [Lachnospiraceae bacterium]|nr:helix-turn-helix transcriptional regulator [Lachnospiraceae bacterium]
MDFGKKIRELREKKHLTQSDVVNMMGKNLETGKPYLSLRGYMAYEQNNSRPRQKSIYEKLAEILECNINYLLVDDSNYNFAIDNTSAIWTSIKEVLPTLNLALKIIIDYDINNKGFLYKIWSGIENDQIKKDKTKDYLLDIKEKNTFFNAVAFKVIMEYSMSRGENFVINSNNNSNRIEDPDDILVLNKDKQYEWWIYYFSISSLNVEIKNYNDIINDFIKNFVLNKVDINRKISIVTDDEDFNKAMEEHKDSISLYANLTVILLDIGKYRVISENYITQIKQ